MTAQVEGQMENVFFVADRAGDAIDTELTRLVEERPDVVVLSADMGGSLPGLRDKHPDRYIELGIAETNSMSVAAGMAASGMTPYIVSMAPFGAIKCAEQIRTDLAYNRLPVRILARMSGLAMGYFGPSHHAVEDIAIARSIAGLTVVGSADDNAALALMRETIDHAGPVFIRLSSAPERVVYPDVPRLPQGGVLQAREGSDVSVLATGTGVAAALGAAEELQGSGVSVAVFDIAYLKPLDEQAIAEAVAGTGTVLTVEEHNVVGGLGSAVAEIIGRRQLGARIELHGLPDTELDVGTPAVLLDRYGITSAGVASKIRQLLGA